MLPKKSSSNSKNFVKKVILILIGLCILLFVINYLKKSLFIIKNTICTHDSSPCSDSLQTKFAQSAEGKSLFSFSDSYAQELIKNNFPEIKSFQLQKKYFPPALVWQIFLRVPVAVIRADKDYQIDEDGVIIADNNTNVLPQLKVDVNFDHLDIGNRFSQEYIIKSLALIKFLKLNLLEPTEINVISKFSTEIKLKTGEILVFSTQEDGKNKLDSLQLIFSRAKIEGKKISYIDLRFDKPVIVYE